MLLKLYVHYLREITEYILLSLYVRHCKLLVWQLLAVSATCCFVWSGFPRLSSCRLMIWSVSDAVVCHYLLIIWSDIHHPLFPSDMLEKVIAGSKICKEHFHWLIRNLYPMKSYVFYVCRSINCLQMATANGYFR